MSFPTDPAPTQVKITTPTVPGPPNDSQWLIPGYPANQSIDIMGTSGKDVYAVFLYTSPAREDPLPAVYCQCIPVIDEPGVFTWSGVAFGGVNDSGVPIVGTILAKAVDMAGHTLSWTAANFNLTP